MVIPIVIGKLGEVTKGLVKGLVIGQYTEQSPGDLRRLAVTQNQVEDHQLTLGWKTLKGVK